MAMRNRALLLGHRGARGVKDVAENTLASFDLALSQGCDGFEFDVRLTGDAQAVICHDATIRGLEISQHTAQSLALPSLRQVLARYQNTAFLDIELKIPGLDRITIDLLRKCQPRRGFVVSSFIPEVLTGIYNFDKTIPLGLICETKAQLSLWNELPVSYVIPHYKLLSQRLLLEIKAERKKVFVWTVNSPATIKRFSSWQVDGIISDCPERLSITLAQQPASQL
ncbi:MAG TPA: glycerophosphodiester phosphodiesterase [Candidatus Dormibacteraeota bacterium]|nr:glycerophosphodiester phosphodiesterase [Candidatus Dormibacteraeota bacterium]